MIADPSLKPQVALAWAIQAANTMQNINGCLPFQLVFGRLPQDPSLVEDNPGANKVIADSQAQWARHYRTMMMAREHFAAAEADSAIAAEKPPEPHADAEGSLAARPRLLLLLPAGTG